MYRFIIALIAIATISCSKSKDSSNTLHSNPRATVSNRLVTLDATGSTGVIVRWTWTLDTTAIVAPAPLIWYPARTFTNQPLNTATNATLPSAGNYVFGLTVWDAAGNWDYGVVTINAQ